MAICDLSYSYKDGNNSSVKLSVKANNSAHIHNANGYSITAIGILYSPMYNEPTIEILNDEGLNINIHRFSAPFSENLSAILPIIVGMDCWYRVVFTYDNDGDIYEYGDTLRLKKTWDKPDYENKEELAPLYKMLQQGQSALGEFGSDLASSNFSQSSITIDGSNEWVENIMGGETSFYSVPSKTPNYWFALQFITDTVVSYIGCNSMFAVAEPNGGDLVDQAQGIYNGATIPAGTIIYGKFTNIQIDSGMVMCYKNNPNAIITGLNY